MEEKINIDITTKSDSFSDCSNQRVKDAECSGKCNSGCNKLDVQDWLKDVNKLDDYNEVIEVRFKNTRKAYFSNKDGLRLKKGDVIAVESSPGHDIGVVSLTGQLVLVKMRADGVNPKDQELKRIYRKAKPADVDKWRDAIAREHQTMIRSRQLAADLQLNMKIGDVEYQGDGTKAIFYYIADERVDFRQLIKVLAEQFKIRVEMRQIGARQEAGRIGGIGSCGRELCCSSWVTNFVSVTTNAARYQEVSLNPQKLAGQCGKLKCCLNYELAAYLDAQKDFPDTSVRLKTQRGKAYHQKTDVFKGLMWYMYEEDDKKTLTCLSVDTVKEVISQNKKNKFPEKLKVVEETTSSMAGVVDYQDQVGMDSLTRFEDKPVKKNDKRKGRKGPRKGGNNNRPQGEGGNKPQNRNNKNNNRNRNRNKDNNRNKDEKRSQDAPRNKEGKKKVRVIKKKDKDKE